MDGLIKGSVHLFNVEVKSVYPLQHGQPLTLHVFRGPLTAWEAQAPIRGHLGSVDGSLARGLRLSSGRSQHGLPP